MQANIIRWWIIKLLKTLCFCTSSLEINQWNVHCFTPVLFNISCTVKTPDLTLVIQIAPIYLSNKSILTNISISLNLLMRLCRRKHTLFACSANFPWACVINPLEENNNPKWDIFLLPEFPFLGREPISFSKNKHFLFLRVKLQLLL